MTFSGLHAAIDIGKLSGVTNCIQFADVNIAFGTKSERDTVYGNLRPMDDPEMPGALANLQRLSQSRQHRRSSADQKFEGSRAFGSEDKLDLTATIESIDWAYLEERLALTSWLLINFSRCYLGCRLERRDVDTSLPSTVFRQAN